MLRIVKHRRFVVILGVAYLALAAMLTKHHSESWNDRSRIATIDALATHHTFAIAENSAFKTGDKYRYAGKFYSDKPPNLAIAGAAVDEVLSLAGISLDRKPDLAYFIITLALVGVAYAGGLVALYEALRIISVGELWSTCVTLVAGTATFLLPYATLLNNHVVSGALVMIGFRLLIDPHSKNRAIALGGGAMALAATIDISFAIFVMLAPLLFVRRGLGRTIVPFAAAVLPLAAAYFAFNYALSGNLMPPALNVTLWQYPGSHFGANNMTGLAVHRSLSDHARYAVDLLVGNHGLFLYMPILILSVDGLIRGWQNARMYRPEIAFIAFGCTLYVASYVWSSNDYSGYAYGIRWYTGIVYLAMIPLGFIESAIANVARMRAIFLSATCISGFVATVGLFDTITPNDVGIPPFIYNLRFMQNANNFPRDVVYMLVFICSMVLVCRLVALVTAAAASRVRTGRPVPARG